MDPILLAPLVDVQKAAESVTRPGDPQYLFAVEDALQYLDSLDALSRPPNT